MTEVQPSCGPWAGGTDVSLVGEGLVGSSAAAAKFVVTTAEGDEGGSREWSGDAMKCVYDASASCLRLVTVAADAIGAEPSSAKLHVTLDGITWTDTSLSFNLYPQIEWAEPKPKAFTIGTKGGTITIAPTSGSCVVSGHVTVRFVCGETQLEEVGTSDATGVSVQAPDFADAGDYTVLVALNGKQVTARVLLHGCSAIMP